MEFQARCKFVLARLQVLSFLCPWTGRTGLLFPPKAAGWVPARTAVVLSPWIPREFAEVGVLQLLGEPPGGLSSWSFQPSTEFCNEGVFWRRCDALVIVAIGRLVPIRRGPQLIGFIDDQRWGSISASRRSRSVTLKKRGDIRCVSLTGNGGGLGLRDFQTKSPPLPFRVLRELFVDGCSLLGSLHKVLERNNLD